MVDGSLNPNLKKKYQITMYPTVLLLRCEKAQLPAPLA
jgi:hypothetical protein